MNVLVIFGTRPEAIKMAPVITALRSDARFQVSVCTTGQHLEMVASVLGLFKIKPDFDLHVMRPGQDLNGLFARALTSVSDLLSQDKFDRVLVHGDTTTSAAASLAAFHRQVPVGHVEAGLRTGRFDQPWPEEMNRRIADLVADHLFAPTPTARKNLESENLGSKLISVTGNTVIDALIQTVEMINRDDQVRRSLEEAFSYLSSSRRLILLTCHRRESFGETFQGICGAVRKISENQDLEIVCPVHMNPNVYGPIRQAIGHIDNVHLIEPLDYLSFVYLMKRSTLILTDSGGVQEEAPSLGKPVLVLRDVTERPEAVAAGTVRLIGTRPESIIKAVTESLELQALGATGVIANPYGDGHAAQRIVDALSS